MRIVFALVIAASLTLSAESHQGLQSQPTLPAEMLLDRTVLQALDEELSGVAAKDHVARLTQFHRVPASPGFHDAVEYLMGRAKAFGLSDVHVATISLKSRLLAGRDDNSLLDFANFQLRIETMDLVVFYS